MIRDLDYFDVFNDSDLLVDVLVRVSKGAVYCYIMIFYDEIR